jgi:hypothetical protein
VRFCLLNPWPNGALSQACATIRLVAGQLGHAAIECHTTREILDARPEFVLAMQYDTPKLTPFPTYGLIHEPISEYLRDPVFLMNLLSYDGYFALSDNHRDFIRNLLVGAKREVSIGSYFCATGTSLPCDWRPNFAAARAAYVGLNWDRRNDVLFRELDALGCLDVYGPEANWLFLSRGDGGTYRGPLAFDERSVHDAYRRAGIGLCLAGDNWAADDIVSARVFEATAAGAVAIVARMPWVEKSFGESVLYLDQDDSFTGIAARIDAHVRWVRAHPEAAQALVETAQAIYRSRFDQRVLLENVFAYHRQQVAGRASRASRSAPTLSVVLRVTGRAHADRQRALDSVAMQEGVRIEVVEVADGGSLTTALRRCSGPYVTVMSDENEWLPGHVSSLLETLSSEDAAAAYAETILHLATPFRAAGADGEVRKAWFACTDDGPLTPERALQRLPLGSVLFRADLLDGRYLDGPSIATAEDARLLLTLCSRTRLVGSGRLTVVAYAAPGRSLPRLAGDGLDPRDELSLRLQFRAATFPARPPGLDPQILRSLDVSRGDSIRRAAGRKHYLLPSSLRSSILPESGWRRVATAFTHDNVKLSGESSYGGPAVFPAGVRLPEGGWAYGMVVSPALEGRIPHVLRLHCQIESGPVSFGVLYNDGKSFAYRLHLAGQPDRLSVDLPLMFPGEASQVVVSGGGGVDPVRVIVFGVEVYEVGSAT